MMKSTWILALVWVLVLLASPLYAGHALNSPVATTNPGDFWCSGNADFDGTVVFDGVCTYNANAIFTLDLTVGSNITCDAIDVSATIACDNLTVAVDATVADDLVVTDDVTISGELKGARCLLGCGNQVTNQTVDKYLKGAGGWSWSEVAGYCMNRAGSIVGVTMNYIVDSYSDTPTVECEVRVGDVVVYSVSETVDGTGSRSIYGTQARGTDTFSAGDIITAKIDVTGTIQYDYPGGYIEVVFDD